MKRIIGGNELMWIPGNFIIPKGFLPSLKTYTKMAKMYLVY